jgi:hypothetical protein
MRKLNQKEKRTLKFGAVCAIVVLGFAFATPLLNRWKQARNLTAGMEDKIEAINISEAKQAGLMSIVPVFEMPKKEEEQQFLFRDKFSEQLKKAGIKSKPLQVLTGGKSGVAGYELLRLKCNANCRFVQALDLLARLNENPYLVTVEEFKIAVDEKKPQEVEMDLTVSTFVR